MNRAIRVAAASIVLIVADAAAGQEVVTIRSLESADVFQAQFNPKELSVDKQVPWKKHKTSEADNPTLEFTAAEPKTLSVELLFDTFENGTSVQELISPLEILATVDPMKKRPPLVRFTWGNALPVFTGVIESINVKYTLFLPDGTPVRAAVAVAVKEATTVRVKKGPAASLISCQTPSDCPPGQSCFNGACAPAP